MIFIYLTLILSSLVPYVIGQQFAVIGTRSQEPIMPVCVIHASNNHSLHCYGISNLPLIPRTNLLAVTPAGSTGLCVLQALDPDAGYDDDDALLVCEAKHGSLRISGHFRDISSDDSCVCWVCSRTGGVGCSPILSGAQCNIMDDIGPYVSVISSGGYRCGLRVDGALVCADGSIIHFDLPIIQVQAASTGQLCFLLQDGSITCNLQSQRTHLIGPYSTFAVSLGAKQICGIASSSESRIECFSTETFRAIESPSPFGFAELRAAPPAQLSSDRLGLCASRIGSGELLCWPIPASKSSQTSITSVAIGAYGAGICEDGKAIVLWSPVYNSDSTQLPDRVTVGHNESSFMKLIGLPPWQLCAIRHDYTAQCYLTNPVILPDEPFLDLSADYNNVCGIKKTDGRLWCSHDIVVPHGQYLSLSCGRYCVAIAINHTLVLWAIDSTTPPPEFGNVTFVVHDAAIGLYGNQLCLITYHDNITHCYDDDAQELIVPTLAVSGIIKLSAAGSGFTCGLLNDTSIFCWSYASHTGTMVVQFGTDMIEVVGGPMQSCGRHSNNTWKCVVLGSSASGAMVPIPILVAQPAPVHKYASAGVTLDCPLGTYSAHPGATTSMCSGPCAAGRFANNSQHNTDQCAGSCIEGHYCGIGFNEPKSCPAGRFGRARGLVTAQCTDIVPAGFWSGAGSSTPKFCANGVYGEKDGLTTSECSGPCSAGYYCPPGSTSPTAVVCGGISAYCPERSPLPLLVPDGYSSCGGNSTSTRDSIELCWPGHYCQNGQQIKCAIGTYTNVTGSLTCQRCPIGRFQDMTAQSFCVQCAAGKTSSDGRDDCNDCNPGLFNTDGVECRACPSGTVAPESSTSCHQCEVDHVPSATSSVCVPCGRAQVSQPGDATCTDCSRYPLVARNGTCVCDQGFFMANATSCTECPREADCSEIGTTLDSLYAIEGYWHKPRSTVFHACLTPGLCPGGSDQCATHRDGILCASCIDGWTEWKGTCRECPSEIDVGAFAVILLYGMVLVTILHITAQSVFGGTKIYIFYLSTLVLIVGSLDSFISWINIFDITNAALSRNGCPARMSQRDQILWSLIIPVLLFIQLMIVAGIHRLISYTCGDHMSRLLGTSSLLFKSAAVKRTCWALVIFSYTSIAATCLRYLQCTDLRYDAEIGGNVAVVLTSPSIICGSPEWNHGLPIVVIIATIDVIGLPLGIYLWMRRREIPLPSSPRAYLTETYAAPVGHYWEALSIVRRSLFVIIEVIFTPTDRQQWRYFAFIMLIAICYKVHLIIQPWKSTTDNIFEEGSLIMLFIVTLFLWSLGKPYDDNGHIVIAISIALPTLVVVMTQMRRCYRRCYNSNNGDQNKNGIDNMISDKHPLDNMVSSVSSGGVIPFAMNHDRTGSAVYARLPDEHEQFSPVPSPDDALASSRLSSLTTL